ncbi:MAG: permease [Deltaproteobacteria bacterium]|nr:permease [Deltaproteobacteria bacterium]
MISRLLKEIFFLFNEVAIFLLLGFIIAGVLHVIFSDSIIKKHFGKNSLGAVIKSTIFGIPLPLCSCAVIPVAASLRNSGASKGASISFLISTPQVGADSFFITYSLLGYIFAFFRIIASVITAIAAGITVNLYSGKKNDEPAIKSCVNIPEELFLIRLKNFFGYIQFELFGSISDAFIIGIIIAGAISAFIPDTFFTAYLNSPFLSMIIMLGVGIPLYVCASASTPIAAALIMKGISPGAALVFLLTGPATNAITISTVVKSAGKKTAIVYIISIAVISVAFGYLLNIITLKYGFSKIISASGYDMLPLPVKYIGSAVLIGMFVLHYIKKFYLDNIRQNKTSSEAIRLNVNGMSCMHCASSVKKAVEAISETSDIQVNLQGKFVEFNIKDKNKIDAVKNLIIAAGFEIA